ncbi:minor tail protein [Mycobacterium phage Chaelin]|uniref:Minor tail protein n=1 Tax=Mycobacterium phage Chaelin TaxID=2725630 RepID=A0A6M3SZ33_9CAUD|nr:minor tail protein [Mycobacterium phage Chaelin]
MAFRGYFALNGVEIANSSRVAAHIGAEVPTRDIGLMTADVDCSLTPIDDDRLLAELPDTSVPIGAGRLLATPPDGSRLYGPGLAVVGDCWTPNTLCFGCRTAIEYDDSWTGLPAFLNDHVYRPELAPWFTTRVPESAEFAGVWVMDVKGLDVTTSQREVIEMAGDGGAAGIHRDGAQRIQFDVLLVACTNAGATYGLDWLTTQLRRTNDRTDSVLRYLAAHPEDSAVDPTTLVRDRHGVVLTAGPEITGQVNASGRQHNQATFYRVTFELTALIPHAYRPATVLPVEWDTVEVEPIQWVHSSECKPPADCSPMPVLFAQGCEVERVEAVSSPPPVCGGCMPVCAVATHAVQIPLTERPQTGTATMVSLAIRNTDARPLTLNGYFRRCNARDDCDDELFPVQIHGLPATAEVVLDGVTGRFWVYYAGRKWRPVHIVGTPSGAPWVPAKLDRTLCWEFVVVSDGTALFEVDLALTDRDE